MGAKPVRSPLPKGNTNESVFLTDPKRYRTLISRILYLSLTRSDISYVVQQPSQFVNTPQHDH